MNCQRLGWLTSHPQNSHGKWRTTKVSFHANWVELHQGIQQKGGERSFNMLSECYSLLPMGWWDENGTTHRQKPSNKKKHFFLTKWFVKHQLYLPITCAKIPRSLVQEIQKRRRHIRGSPSEPFGRRWPTQGLWWKTWRVVFEISPKTHQTFNRKRIIDSQYEIHGNVRESTRNSQIFSNFQRI